MSAEGVDQTGDSLETAVVIMADNSIQGIEQEYRWVQGRFGQQGYAWNLIRQALLEHDGHMFDRLDIRLADGSERAIYFDITHFFGKF